MSTEILDTSSPISADRNISLLVVQNVQRVKEDLADYVRRMRSEKGLSLKDVEVKSGGRISKGYVGQIENRTVLGQSVTPQKLQALSVGLGVSEDEIFAVARGKSLEPMTPTDFSTALQAMGVEQFYANGDIESLTDEDRQEIIAVIRAIIEQKLPRRRSARKSTGKTKK